MTLSLVLALHVTDEALTDFLSVYNPTVRAIRKRFPFLPLPTFTFGWWLAGLIAAVVALLVLSVFAFRGARWMVPLAYVFVAIMIANGCGHIIASIYRNKWMPGVYSSPVVLLAAAILLIETRQFSRQSSVVSPS